MVDQMESELERAGSAVAIEEGLTKTSPTTDSLEDLAELAPMTSTSDFKTKVSKRKSDSDEPQHALLKKLALSDAQPSTSGASLCVDPTADTTLEQTSPNGDRQPVVNWIEYFHLLSNADKMLALSALVDSCSLSHIRHLSDTIEPFFQKDFISCLPKELSLHILSMLDASDLQSAASVSKVWRTLTEDHLLWRHLCKHMDYTSKQLPDALTVAAQSSSETTSTSTEEFGSCYVRSPWKSLYLRHQRIDANWRHNMQPLTNRIVMRGHDEHVITCLQIHEDLIVSGSDDNTLKVWDAQTAELKYTLSGHVGGVWSSQLSADGKIVASGSTDRTVRIWSTETGQLLHTLLGHTSTVRCMALHQNALVSGSRDTTLRLWDLTTGDCVHVFTGHVAAVRCVQFDGRRVVSGAYDYTLKVWDAVTRECVHTLCGHTNRVYSLIMDSANDLVVSGSLDTTIRVWNIKHGTQLHTLIGHQSLTSGLALRDGLLISGNADSTVKVWNVRDGSCVHTLTGPNKHQSAVTSLAMLDNRLLATCSDDGTAKLWDVRQGVFVRDLVRLDSSGGSGGCIWRLKATPTRLVCAVGSRNGTEDTKLVLLNFNAAYP